MNLLAYAAAVWQSLFLAGGVTQDDRPATYLPPTTTISRFTPTPTSSNHTALHFPWLFVTFFLVTAITTMFLLIIPIHSRAHVSYADDKARGKLVAAKRHLVAHMLSRALRAILYGVIIRKCLPTMAVFFTRWATPNWMANCAGAATTLAILAPTLLRRCFSYAICLVYLQWPVSPDRPEIPPICPTMPVAISSSVDCQNPQPLEETSDQASQETITVPETSALDNNPIPEFEVSVRADATELIQTGTAIQDLISSDSLANHVEPQHGTREDLERTVTSVLPLRDENTFTANSETRTEEWVSGGHETTFDELGTIRIVSSSVIELFDEHQHHDPAESPTKVSYVHSDSLPGAVVSLIQATLDRDVGEVSGSLDNLQATSSCPTPSDHVDSLATPPSSSELILPDPPIPVRISQPPRANFLTELPFDGEDLPLIDVHILQLSLPDTNVIVDSPTSLVKPELDPFYAANNTLSTNSPPTGPTSEPMNGEGNSVDLFEPSTPIQICRTTEHYLATNYALHSPRGGSNCNTPPSPVSPVRYSVRFDLPTTSPVTSIGDNLCYVANSTATPPLSSDDEVVPYNWDIDSTSDDEINVLSTNLSSIDDDLLKESTSFTAPPRPSSPRMSIRELDPAYRDDNEFMSFFWSTATREESARLGEDDNLLDVYIDFEDYGREPVLEPIGAPDDYSDLEPSVSMQLDDIFPDTRWRDEDDLLNDTDLPDQPDVEEDWVLTEEMRTRIIELKKQFDARLAASQGEFHETLVPFSSSSHSFDSSAIPATSSSPVAPSIVAPEIHSGTVSLSTELLSPLQTCAGTTVARPSSPPSTKSPPTMLPRARSRPKSSLMNLTSAPTATRGLGSWR
ncbi:hypothetical protein C0992_008683 [Termitomyces sp. T32_za158]|nr:hypothetical protein C0992_008683 [Termitomyces sp. T32_za158]